MFSMERVTSTTAAVEVWKDIPGLDGAYQVSTFGRVRSVDRIYYKQYKDGHGAYTHHKGRILKQRLNEHGYWIVSIVYKCKSMTFLVHRLVAIVFIPNPDNFPEVNHKDENPLNSHVDNLEWCDRLYNIRYGTGIERHMKPRRRKIEQLTKDGQHVAYHLGVREICEATGMNRRSIQRCLHNKPRHNTAYGYKWRFVDVSADEVEFDINHSLAKYERKEVDRTVEQLTKDGQHVAYFPNSVHAARAVSRTLQNIRRAIKHPNHTSAGYRWRMVKDI